MELLNARELATRVKEVSYEPSHADLVDALRSCYPDSEVIYVAARGDWTCDTGRLLAGSREVASDWRQWAEAKYAAAGGDARKVWLRHRARGLMVTEIAGESIYLAVPYGSAADAFFQIEIEARHEVTKRYLFNREKYAGPQNLVDILDPIFPGQAVVQQEVTPWVYCFQRLTDIRRFVRDVAVNHQERQKSNFPDLAQKTVQMVTLDGSTVINQSVPFFELYPDWLEQPPYELRFLRDWEQSSAGRGGHRLCDHWFLRLMDYVNHEGRRVLGFIPQWADSDGGTDLPRITADEEASVFGIMAEVERFDTQTGYPFSWYFYMLHDNRVAPSVGRVLARGLREGRIRLPEGDEAVLMQWDKRPYVF